MNGLALAHPTPQRRLGAWACAALIAALALLAAPGLALADTFTGGAITINDQAASTPFPATIAVTTPETIVEDLNVRLTNLTHPFPEDMDVLLVGPRGQSVVLMSDAGAADNAFGSLTFDDQAPGPVPDTITTGTYRPTNVDDGLADFFPAPAPAGPFGTALSDFNHVDPNGTWSLYVVDDEAVGAGSIASWRLTLAQRRLAAWGVDWPDNTNLPEGKSERFRFHRSPGSPGTFPLYAGAFNWELRGCGGVPSATAGVDFTPASGRIEFAPGETEKFVDIQVTDDHIPEGNECVNTFTSSPEGDLDGRFAGPGTGGGIIDDDPKAAPPSIAKSGAQRVLRQRAVIVKATSNAYGSLSGRGTIKLPSGAAAKVRLKAVRKQVIAGQPTKLRLRLSRTALRQVRLAFASTRRLTARVTVTAKDLAANQASKLVRVRLRR